MSALSRLPEDVKVEANEEEVRTLDVFFGG